ncbi:hypothetical protein HID58_033173 [Brassica napus]|uniref:CCHC-type domain-containing protein n=1 Tax=Brassica napus TaxID=3708 RepID=A0ABQ8BYG8_BRANA|nr:hypothetical protein HID58_033173 [Brassica napus]
MENPWLTVALAPPLKPPTPAGNLSHSPPQPDPPDPPDPLQFPPLPSPLSGGQKPPKRRTFSPLPLISTVPPVPITSSLSLGTAESPVFGSLPSTTSSAAQLLAAFSSILFCGVENPRSDSSTVPQGSLKTVNPLFSLTVPVTLPTPLPPKLPTTITPPAPPANPSTKFCFSCRSMGHLMNNCRKGPQDWTLVNRRKLPTAVDSQTTPPLAKIPIPTSNSQSGPTPVPTSSDRSQNPPVSLPSTPAVSSLQPETEIDPPSMEIDSPCPTKETIIDCSDMDFSSAEASVLALPAKNSWLANKLLLLRDTAYNWIKHLVGNGETTYFWTSHWSPFGNIRKFLEGESCMTVGIPYSTTLAELWVTDHWVLPPARSEKQVLIYAFLTSLQLTDSVDKRDWCPQDEESPLSDPLNQLRLQLYSKCGSLTLLRTDYRSLSLSSVEIGFYNVLSCFMLLGLLAHW